MHCTVGVGYGLCRIALGHYWGYMIGIMESMEYILLVALCAYELGLEITESFECSKYLEPVWWLLFYIPALYVTVMKRRIFWSLNILLAVVSLGILLCFCFGSIPYFNYQHLKSDNDKTKPFFEGGIEMFFYALPVASWMFVGIECVVLITGHLKEPVVSLTNGLLSCTTVLLCTSFAVIILACGQEDIDELHEKNNPLNIGFKNMFGMKYHNASLLDIPATIAHGLTVMYAFGSQMKAMADSTLLPEVFKYTYCDAPAGSLVVGSIVGYVLCVFMFFVPNFFEITFMICFTCAFFMYIGILLSYCIYVIRYKRSSSKFNSPFGLYGAVYGVLIFSLSVVSSLVFVPLDEYRLGKKVRIISLTTC
jgi:amino acid transporter